MALEDVRRLPGAKSQPDGSFLVPCPVPGHGRGKGDRNPSCHVWLDLAKGRMSANCFAGCSFEDVKAEFERMGVWDKPRASDRSEITEWTIYDENGRQVCKHVRIDKPDGTKTFRWEPKGVKPAELLYGLEKLRKAPDGAVVVCEGEKAADAVSRASERAVALGTVCGASSCPSSAVLEHLRGRLVVLWPDNDEPGRKHMQRVALALQGIADEIRWVPIGELPEKADAADLPSERVLELLRASRSAEAAAPRPRGLVTPKDVMGDVLRIMDEYSSRTRSDVVRTGFSTLDDFLNGGWQRRAMSLIAAPTGGGKTTLVGQFAAAVMPYPALVVAPEMTVGSLVRRELLRRAEASMRDYRRGGAPMDRVLKMSSSLSDPKLPLYFLESLSPTTEDIREAALWIKGHHGSLPLVLLDYAQFLTPVEDPKRYLSLAKYAAWSIELANELDAAVLMTSQVNVDPNTKRYSIRETAMLDHSAHLRLDFYVTRKDGEDGDVFPCYFFVAKQRDGVTNVKIAGFSYEPAKYLITEDAKREEMS